MNDCLNDSRFDKRKNAFNQRNKDLLEERETFRLTLRKSKLDELFNSKRFKGGKEDPELENDEDILMEDYEVDINKLIIPENVKLEYKNNSHGDFHFIKSIYLNEISDVNVLKFVLYLLRNSSSAENFKTLIEPEGKIVENLIFHLFNNSDIQIRYEITWILINITCCSNKFHNKMLSPNFLTSLFQLRSDRRLVTHIIWIFENLIDSEATNLKCLLKAIPGFIQFLLSQLKTAKYLDLKLCILGSLKNVFKLKKNEKKLIEFADLVDFVFSNLINDSEVEVIKASILMSFQLCRCKDINLIIIEKEYYKNLYQLFSDTKEYFPVNEFVFKLFSQIITRNKNQFTPLLINDQAIFIISENICAEYIRMHERTRAETLMVWECIRFLVNSVENNEQIASYIQKTTNILGILMRLINTNSLHCLVNDCIDFFFNFYKVSSQTQKKSFLRGEFLDRLIGMLEVNSMDCLDYVLQTIMQLWAYTENFTDTETEFRVKFTTNNIREKLLKIANCCENTKISQNAETLLNTLDYKNYTYL